MNYIVYKITNSMNNKIYIGVTTRDFSTYHGSGSALRRDYKKYGRDKFIKEVLFSYDNIDDMLNKEKELVNEDFIKRDDTYNIILGGGDLNTKGYVSIKPDNPMMNSLIPIDEYKNGKYKTYSSDKVTVKCNDSDTGFKSIDINEFKTGDYEGVTKNQIRIKCEKSTTGYSVISKEEFEKGDYTAWNSNMTTAILKSTNETIYVDINDERWDTGEIHGINMNKIRIYNPNSNEKTKLITASELESYINLGWKTGTGLTWLNKDGKRKMIKHYELENYINDGWKRGKE